MQQPAAITLPGAEGAAGLTLDGLWNHAGADDSSAGAVIAPPHPLYGGSMGSPVVGEIAHACSAAGVSSLCFDWRGIGASGGEPSGQLDQACSDYEAALAFVEESVAGPLIACGYSFGAGTAVRACLERPRVRRLLLVAPPPAMIDAGALSDFAGSVFVAAGGRDDIAPPAAVESMLASVEHHHLLVLPESDHFFMSGLSELGREAARWLGA